MGLRDKMKTWWSMNEQSGERADSHGSTTLTDNNTVGYDTGKISNAADFEKSTGDEYLSTADTIDLSITSDWSIAGWINVESNGQIQYIFFKGSSDTNRSFEISIKANNTLEISFWSAALGQTRIATLDDVIVSTGTWYHFAAAVDISVPSATIWINGSSVTTNDITTGATDLQDDDAPSQVGAQNDNGTPTNEFDGLIDELSIYNALLDQDDVDILYNSGNGIGYAGTLVSNIKQIAGVAIADVKKIAGVAIADVKKIAGVSNV